MERTGNPSGRNGSAVNKKMSTLNNIPYGYKIDGKFRDNVVRIKTALLNPSGEHIDVYYDQSRNLVTDLGCTDTYMYHLGDPPIEKAKIASSVGVEYEAGELRREVKNPNLVEEDIILVSMAAYLICN